MQAVEAEKALLGCMIVDPSVIQRVIGIVQAEDFTAKDRQKLFQRIIDLYESGRAGDVVSLCDSEWKASVLTELAQYGLSSNVGTYALQVAGARLKEELRKQCHATASALEKSQDQLAGAIADLESRIAALKGFNNICFFFNQINFRATFSSPKVMVRIFLNSLALF
mgnify:CR=1 FL=1